MFPSSDRNDLTQLLSGLERYSGLNSGGFSPHNSALSGLASGAFELLLAKVLFKMLERLETLSAPAPSAAPAVAPATFANLPPAATALTQTPNASTVAAQQAYGLAPLVAPNPIAAPAPVTASGVLPISSFPKPPQDNGRGIHWIPTTSQSPGAVDRFVQAAKDMRLKWVTFLNDHANIGANDYLVKQLRANGMEPVMRVYTSGLEPVNGDLGALVRHYKALGVSYFQLYNEPNHIVENGGQFPDVNRYLDLWIPAAKAVLENGGLPGFGALGPGGEFNDMDFLNQSLAGLRARGELGLLDRAWLSIHNYMGDAPLEDTRAFSRFKVYADVLQQQLGRLLPMIGTEGGTYTHHAEDEPRRIAAVTSAYRYMANREPYNFAYSYWVIANSAGGGHDPAWEWQALFKPDGASPLVEALRNLT
jgi:hypothetical protein